jgi:MerR family transcriptional regulator, copper efflux regulator
MTAPQTAVGQADGTVPVACTLTSAGLAAQAARWERLIAGSMTERTQTSDGLRMSFRPEPGVEEELRRLVAVENECCPWAAWTMETNAGATVLDVRSIGPGIAALHDMFRSA